MTILPQCNSTLENEALSEIPIWHQYTYHQLTRFIGGIFAAVAIALSFFLMYMHATHYLKPWEQRHIIRILFMVPLYAMVSWLSFTYYRKAIYFEVIRDCYEAFAIASFFTLLCHYLAQDLHQQKEYFRGIQPRPWIWPLPWLQKCCGGEHGMWRTPRSGLTWFNINWSGVFQYCFIRVFMTCVAVITQVAGRYCIDSLNPAFAHVWVMVIEAVAVSIAMYCIIQFYVQVRKDIAQHKPLLKVAAIKLVIFLSFWQTLAISFFTSTGLIKTTPKFQEPDIRAGLPNLLLCVEMAIFAIFHFWAFSWKPYTPGSKEYQAEVVAGEGPAETQYKGGPLGIYAVLEAFNPWDLIKAVGRAGKWLFVGRKTRMLDRSYAVGRSDTDSITHDQTAYQGTKLNPMGGLRPSEDGEHEPGYLGASRSARNPIGATRPGLASAGSNSTRPVPRYPGVDKDAVGGAEGEELLADAQLNPYSDPRHFQRNSDPPYLPTGVRAGRHSEVASNDDDSSGNSGNWDRPQHHHTPPYPVGRDSGPPHIHVTHPSMTASDHGIGVTPMPYYDSSATTSSHLPSYNGYEPRSYGR